MRRRHRPGAALVVTVGLAGCGIPVDNQPQTMPGGVVSAALPSRETTPEAQTAPALDVSVFLVRDGRVVPVTREGTTPGVAAAVESLLRGPTTDEVAGGVRSAIAPGTRVLAATVSTDGTATLDLTTTFVEVGGQEQILAVAQLVLTATAVPGVTRVSIALDGQIVEVPRADGTLAAGPSAAADYAALLDASGPG